MKLTPKAKPVRIRIQSGGEEHASLDSLKRNFCLSDIQLLLDNRLVRWLKQQNEEKLANEISQYNENALLDTVTVFNLYKLIFAEIFSEKEFHSLLDLAQYWSGNVMYKKNAAYLYHYLLDKDVEAAIELFTLKDKYKINKSLEEWRDIFEQFNDIENPVIDYIKGVIQIEGFATNNKKIDAKLGYEMVDKAARQSLRDAYDYLCNHPVNEYFAKHSMRFCKVDDTKINKWLELNIQLDNSKYSEDDYANEEEKCILEFLRECIEVKRFYRKSAFKALTKAEYYFENIDVDDILHKEKKFILAILNRANGSESICKNILVNISDFPLAAHMLTSERTFNEVNFKSMRYDVKIDYVMQHLFDNE